MRLIECPRDAWQGISGFIPTRQKIAYLNELLTIGFDTIDFGSFVSAKAMPQVSDTAAVLDGLDASGTKLLAIVANERGAVEACLHERIDYLGYPFSISETFQRRNTNAGIEASFERVKSIASVCDTSGKKLVIYISMGFGNPYGDHWEPSLAMEWVEKLAALNITTFSLADTIGMARPEDITSLFSKTIPAYPHLQFGAHFHTRPDAWRDKIDAAYQAGCRRFDGALLGYGGCPMAQDDLIGNMPTEKLIAFAREQGEGLQIDEVAVKNASQHFLRLINK